MHARWDTQPSVTHVGCQFVQITQSNRSLSYVDLRPEQHVVHPSSPIPATYVWRRHGAVLVANGTGAMMIPEPRSSSLGWLPAAGIVLLCMSSWLFNSMFITTPVCLRLGGKYRTLLWLIICMNAQKVPTQVYTNLVYSLA